MSTNIDIPWACGTRTVPATPEQAEKISNGDIEAAAALLGMTPQQYDEWRRDSGWVRCCATTKAGLRCRGFVTGLQFIDDPRDWAEASGLCPTHESRTAP